MHGPDVDENARVVGRVGAGQGDKGAGVAATTARNLDLGASNVELSLVRLRGHVKGDLLNAQEVLAIGCVGGDGSVARLVRVWLREVSMKQSSSSTCRGDHTLRWPDHLLVAVHGGHGGRDFEPDSA